MKTVTLNNGVEMPVLGLGTYKTTDPSECLTSVRDALELGYRMIDTAQFYDNEEFVGQAVASSDVPREDIFITTKVWPTRFSDARASLMESMKKLRTDYIDLVLLHWPYGDIYAAWRDLEAMNREGLVRAIGVSNFNTDRLIDLMNFNEIAPAVNQIETNLYAQRLEEHEWLERLGVVHEGYMPFGQGRIDELFQSPRLLEIAARHGKSTRQVALRYQLQCGVIIIPKSVHRERIRANADVFDFELSPAEMLEIRSMDKGAPMTGTPETPDRVMKVTGFRLPDGK